MDDLRLGLAERDEALQLVHGGLRESKGHGGHSELTANIFQMMYSAGTKISVMSFGQTWTMMSSCSNYLTDIHVMTIAVQTTKSLLRPCSAPLDINSCENSTKVTGIRAVRGRELRFSCNAVQSWRVLVWSHWETGPLTLKLQQVYREGDTRC